MKNSSSFGPALWFCLIVCMAATGWTLRLAADLKRESQKEFQSVYLLLIIQARQIETLQNLHLRELNQDIQNRLAEERKKYET